jgi:hypothetical protein
MALRTSSRDVTLVARDHSFLESKDAMGNAIGCGEFSAVMVSRKRAWLDFLFLGLRQTTTASSASVYVPVEVL